jgi:serine protease Do
MDMKKIMASILTAMVGGFFSLAAYHFLTHNTPNQGLKNTTHPSFQKVSFNGGSSISPGTDFTHAAERTVNGVVHIKTIVNSSGTQYLNPFEQFFYGNPFQQKPMPQMGAGSGVVITPDGYVVTNHHVIENADELEVTLNNKKTYKAKLIGSDPNTDLAVIKIDATDLPIVPFGNSDQVKIGEWVLAVGNPFNLTSTVTAGIVSAKGRNIDIIQENYKIESFIQTDAAVNPGNSGGALVNINGELVGINTAISTHTGSFEGYSFAVPSNLVNKVAADIIQFGTVQRGLLGVNIREITAEFATEKNINELEGVWVEAPMPGSAAETAGLKPEDIILSINGIKVKSVSELQEQIGMYRPGDKIILKIKRRGEEKELTAVLKNKAGSTDLVDAKAEANQALGGSFRSLSADELKKLGLSGGVEVVDVGTGKLRAAGIKQGFIITEINGKKISKPNDVVDASSGTKGMFYIGGMYRSGERVFYSFN